MLLRVVSNWFIGFLFLAFAIGYGMMAIEMMKEMQTVKPIVYKIVLDSNGYRNIASEVSNEH